MGYRAAEEITLPARFLTTTAHLIAVLTILFDVNTLAAQMLLAGGDEPPERLSAADLGMLTTQLKGIGFAAVGCFGVEFIGLFLGVSLFMRGHSCLYILLHFAGTILTGLAYTQAWSVGALITCLVLFNCLPAALELLTFVFVARISFFAY